MCKITKDSSGFGAVVHFSDNGEEWILCINQALLRAKYHVEVHKRVNGRFILASQAFIDESHYRRIVSNFCDSPSKELVLLVLS